MSITTDWQRILREQEEEHDHLHAERAVRELQRLPRMQPQMVEKVRRYAGLVVVNVILGAIFIFLLAGIGNAGEQEGCAYKVRTHMAVHRNLDDSGYVPCGYVEVHLTRGAHSLRAIIEVDSVVYYNDRVRAQPHYTDLRVKVADLNVQVLARKEGRPKHTNSYDTWCRQEEIT